MGVKGVNFRLHIPKNAVGIIMRSFLVGVSMNFWIVMSLAAMAANAGKVLTIRRFCGGVDSTLLVLCSRALSAVVLLPILFATGNSIPRSGLFWGVVAITAIITAVASVLLTEAIKKGNMAAVMPAQATVPIFMLLFLVIVFGEHPSGCSIFWTAAAMGCLGATLYFSSPAKTHSKTTIFTVFSVFAAVLFGIGTVLDRTAITAAAGGALAYSACWNFVSAVILGVQCQRKKIKWYVSKKNAAAVAVFSLLALGAFFCQQYAVQLSASLAGGVVNVKTIVMLHLPIVVAANYFISSEKYSKRLLFFGFLTIVCGIALIRGA
ncbi:MAG: hypothetical protein A2Y12_02350 [Planctomycetes bacterium GWF2_42_9]|nr:MAG: hypothetical protein A2Y12_02350 [Planctomycetes bacterium GWF2_42_9]